MLPQQLEVARAVISMGRDLSGVRVVVDQHFAHRVEERRAGVVRAWCPDDVDHVAIGRIVDREPERPL